MLLLIGTAFIPMSIIIALSFTISSVTKCLTPQAEKTKSACCVYFFTVFV